MEEAINLPAGIEVVSGLVWHAPRPNLGPCCACGSAEGVDTLAMINRKSLVKVKGGGCWSCCTCGATDGAAVVLCASCRQQQTPVRWGCRGRPGSDGRAPIEEFTEPCQHDLSKHPEYVCTRN